MRRALKCLLALLALSFPAFAARFDCTWTGGGVTTDWSDPLNWNNCNGTYPHNNGGDTYTATGAIVAPIVNGQTVVLGHSVSGWQVSFDATSNEITCADALCPFTAGMIVTYVRSTTFAATTVYPAGTGAGPGARSCVDTVNPSPTPHFRIKIDNCAGALVDFTSAGTGTFYMREYQPALQVNSPGSCEVQSGGVLRLEGDFRFGNPNAARDICTVRGGGRLTYSSALATNPSMTSYYAFNASAVLTQGARLRLEGTSGNPAIWESDVTGGALPAAKHINGTYDGTYGGDLFVDYADISCIGLSSGTVGNQIWAWATTATGSLSIKHSVLHACPGGTTVGPMGWASGANGVATNQYVFEDNKWLDGSDGCIGYDVSSTNAPTGAGLRSIKRNVMTCRLGDSNAPAFRDGEIEYNVFINTAPNLSLLGANVWNYSRYNIFINSDVNTAAGIGMFGQGGGVVSVHHLLLYNKVCGNVRGFVPSSGTPDDQVYEWIYGTCAQGTSPSDGDIFMSAGGGTKVTLRHFLIAPVWNAPGGPRSSGGLGTGGSNIRPWTIHNGLWYNCSGRTTVGNVTGCSLTTAESGDGVAGMIANYTGNLIYGDTSFSTNSSHGTGTGTTGNNFPGGGRIVTNTFAAAGANWNGCFIKGGSCNSSSVYGSQNNAAAPPWNSGSGVTLDNFGTHYDVPMTGGTVPGANDMNNEQPYFADPRRTMEQWAQMHGETADVTGVQDYWTNISTADLSSEIPRVFNWLFAGWTPFNIKYAQPGSPANGKHLGPVKPSLMFGTF